MDIVSRFPVEIAHQVLSNLDIQDVAACQQVSRQWYWIAIDPLVWKSVFLEREKTFAIPTGLYPFPTKGKGVVQQSSAAQSTLATPATTSDSSNSSSSSTFSSSSSFSSLSSVSFSGLKSRLTGAITTATSATASATTTPAAAAAQSAATANGTTSTANTSPNTDDSVIMSTMRDRDWKKECRTRIMTDRNWARGHIQAVFTLKLHKGAIARLRIKSGKLLSADMFGQVALWDTTTYKCDGVIEAAVGPIQLLDFSIAAMVMTVISKSGVCRIWDIKSKRLIHSSTATYVTCMTMNDEYLIMGSKDGEIQVIDFMTGQIVASTGIFPGETLQDIYIQNNTLIIATDHHIRILSIDTLELLLTSPLPIPPTTHAYCCVFHIRSLILLTDEHLLHIEWEPLYSHKDDRLLTDTRFELPPNLTKAPLIHRTKIPPILTITSIAIGGKHPHVLTTNADRPSLNDAIRVCPAIPRHHFYGNPGDEFVEASRSRSRSRKSQPIRRDDVPRMPLEDDDEEEEEEEMEDDELDLGLDGSEAEGIVLTSQVDAINDYLKVCGLKPSFMDVDEDVIVVGTSKGDIVVLHMMPQD
ncbi:hypothetical protein KI688_000254 [Linnemannia hyalina]|uniref:F-box domain-containing protein n=1 Tax=Linnemannia hyalina TaxID=64524 RepID=A0A9P7Y535_9FUNG|nr:hypothetical protein KI688_000254 [Linnemannia hyalina]